MSVARRQNAAVPLRLRQPWRLVTREPGSIQGEADARVHAEQMSGCERDPIATRDLKGHNTDFNTYYVPLIQSQGCAGRALLDGQLHGPFWLSMEAGSHHDTIEGNVSDRNQRPGITVSLNLIKPARVAVGSGNDRVAVALFGIQEIDQAQGQRPDLASHGAHGFLRQVPVEQG